MLVSRFVLFSLCLPLLLPSLCSSAQPDAPPHFGIAISGGGSRAIAATIGQLRALYNNGWLQQADDLSAVSMGALATAIVINQTTHDGVEKRLGHLSPPPHQLYLGDRDDSSPANLNWTPAGSLAELPQFNWWPNKYLNIAWLVSGALTSSSPWRDFIHASLLQPYLTRDSRQKIIQWPNFIIGATVARDFAAMSGIAPVEFTNGQLQVRSDIHLHDAFGVFTLPAQSQTLKLQDSQEPAALADFLACSSANFSIAFDALKHITGIHSLGDYTIRPEYQGLKIEAISPSPNLAFGDGGYRDFTGLVPLLARGVQNILVLVNTPLGIRSSDNGRLQITSSLPPYFGITANIQSNSTDNTPYSQLPEGTCHEQCQIGTCPMICLLAQNQVFPSEAYRPLIEHMQSARLKGLPGLFYQELPVLPNPHQGVKGNYTARILWVYLDQSLHWWQQLPYALKEEVSASSEFTKPEAASLSSAALCDDAECLSRRLRFPFYSTMGELKLSARQINLLANYTQWTLTQTSRIVYPLSRKKTGLQKGCNSAELIEAFIHSQVEEQCGDKLDFGVIRKGNKERK